MIYYMRALLIVQALHGSAVKLPRYYCCHCGHGGLVAKSRDYYSRCRPCICALSLLLAASGVSAASESVAADSRCELVASSASYQRPHSVEVHFSRFCFANGMTSMQKGDNKALESKLQDDELLKLFVDLVAFDTRSDISSHDTPSSIGQLRLGAYLLNQISRLQLKPVQTKEGVIITKIPATAGYEKAERLCLLAHLDTAPDASGNNVKPALVVGYRGEGIELENGNVIDHEISPELANHIGEDIVVTDGTTLLGGDDKAGIAVLMHLMEHVVDDSIVHGPLTVVFSVDEEIGRSTKYLDIESLDSDFAVTIDGCEKGELDVATFNAEGAMVTFNGRVVHTAIAYGKLKNALKMMADFIAGLPADESPETTKDEAGFYHVHDATGSVAHAELMMILRDFDKEGLEQRHLFVEELVDQINAKYGEKSCEVLFVSQYENMETVLREHPKILEYCRAAFKKAGIELTEKKVRGGTDGSNLSCRGLPCPNIFAGPLNCHGVYECLPVPSLHASYEVTKALVELVAAGKTEDDD